MHLHWIHHVVQVMEIIQRAGWVGWGLFILAYAFCCLFFIPASVLTIGAGAIYGFPGGMLLVLLGNGLGSLGNLLTTRYLLRDWAKRKFTQHPKMHTVAQAVEQGGWKLVFFTRLSPVMPFSLLNYALGLTRISVFRFFVATELGAIPSFAVYVYLGTLMGNLTRIGPELRNHRPLQWIMEGAGLLITVAVTVYVSRTVSKMLKAQLGRHKK